MYLYNVTIMVENDIQGSVKQLLDTQLFSHPSPEAPLSLLQMLDSPHEGTTYCVQLRCQNKDDIPAFQQRHLASIQALLNERHPGKVVFFDSIMEYLND